VGRRKLEPLNEKKGERINMMVIKTIREKYFSTLPPDIENQGLRGLQLEKSDV